MASLVSSLEKLSLNSGELQRLEVRDVQSSKRPLLAPKPESMVDEVARAAFYLESLHQGAPCYIPRKFMLSAYKVIMDWPPTTFIVLLKKNLGNLSDGSFKVGRHARMYRKVDDLWQEFNIYVLTSKKSSSTPSLFYSQKETEQEIYDSLGSLEILARRFSDFSISRGTYIKRIAAYEAMTGNLGGNAVAALTKNIPGLQQKLARDIAQLVLTMHEAGWAHCDIKTGVSMKTIYELLEPKAPDKQTSPST